jgi:hypothetical protein
MRPTPIDGIIELERRILKGLLAEWQYAAAALKYKHGYALAMPGFALDQLDSVMAKWIPEKRLIVFSRNLVREYPWLAVRDVLLHEMAHQLAGEALGEDTAPHGPLFRNACKLLGADPKGTSDLAALSATADESAMPDNDRILLKVQKLLALAQSANKHEAELAMAKAHEFIVRYNVDLLAGANEHDYGSICLGRPARRHTQDEYALASLLGEFYFVQTIWIPAYVLAKNRMGSVLEISATPANLKMAGYVHAFLQRTIGDQWQAFCHGKRLSLHRKTDFALGLLKGFKEKLRVQEQAWERANGSTYALIRRGDGKLKEYFRERYPRRRSISGRGRRIDQDIHNAGMEVGRKTVLSKPVSAGALIRRLMLGR